MCVHGKCVNNNVCECNDDYHGLYCNIPYTLERILFIDITIRIIAGILIISLIGILIKVYLCRENPILKSGN